MSQTQTDVSTDFPDDSEEQCQALVRALKRRRGFGLLFVRCSPAQGEQLIARVRKDIPQKTIDVLRLDEPIDNLYEIIDSLPNKDQLDILFIKGLENSLVDYIKPGIGGQGDYYKEDTVPRILGHLNLQRERFRDNFNICFVFLLPLYALKYFIRRAPDFFDWRSGVWELPTSSELVEQESSHLVSEADYEEYKKLTPQERKQKIFEIQELLKYNYQTIERKAELLRIQGNLFFANNEYEEAAASYDKALELQPNYYQAWYNRGLALSNLGRHEAAVVSFDKVLELQPDKRDAWNNRGIALSTLGKHEAAVASFDKTLELQSDYYQGWNNRGFLLSNLGRYKVALASFDKALELKPDYHLAWYNKARCYALQSSVDLAIDNLQQAIKLNPNKCRERAKTDSAFDSIREDRRFQALIDG